MTKLLLTVIVGAFVAAFAEEVMSREKRGIRVRTRAYIQDFKRGFSEGYGGLPDRSSPPDRLWSGDLPSVPGSPKRPLTGQSLAV